jgi:hypothetical protein
MCWLSFVYLFLFVTFFLKKEGEWQTKTEYRGMNEASRKVSPRYYHKKVSLSFCWISFIIIVARNFLFRAVHMRILKYGKIGTDSFFTSSLSTILYKIDRTHHVIFSPRVLGEYSSSFVLSFLFRGIQHFAIHKVILSLTIFK